MSISETMSLSRQRRWQLKKMEQGLCYICGHRKVAHKDTTRCKVCIVKSRMAIRLKRGCKPRKKNGRGRPQLYVRG